MSAFQVGDRIVHDTTGKVREVIRITPAGAAGTRVSDGPTYHARIIPDGERHPSERGHVADIRRGSYSYPLESWSLVTDTEGTQS